MRPRGKGILALLGTDEDEPESKRGAMSEDDDADAEAEDDDAEAEDAATSLLEAIDAKDAAGVVEAFARLKASC